MHAIFSILLVCLPFFSLAQSSLPPNVILIITDDQGYGDLGFTGNPHVKTPTIDQLAQESIRLTNFYVSPVCAPTRSSLMTGRYSLRTGVHDTYNGGAIMAPEEVTIAEMLKQGGYTTGIFGKWHLGDNHPSRPQDQGFDESVIHLAGGMGQVGDITTFFQGDSSYFDPVLWHNGKQQAYSGYCSDIFADQAVDFIEKNHESPFFCYLSFNAPHTPLQVPDAYYQLYKDIDPTSSFADDGRPFPEMSEKNKEDARKVYAMITNIDDNIKKLTSALEELAIAENTILIFMTDNGPQQPRYLAGLRGLKSSVYRGGVRVPFFLRYPALTTESQDIETTTAHLDILPTLADLCQVPLPPQRVIDGHSLLPLFQGRAVDWADRPLFFSWTRKYPELYQNVALQQGSYKLIGQTSYNADITDFELFDLHDDPYEQRNLVNEQPELAQQMKQTLDQHFFELIHSPNLVNPPRIVIGSEAENPVYLSRNDASGERGIWSQEDIYGTWRIRIEESGHYTLTFKFLNPINTPGRMHLELGTLVNYLEVEDNTTDEIVMENVYLPATEGDMIPFYTIDNRRIFPFWVEVEKID